jgi:hypothetical protein
MGPRKIRPEAHARVIDQNALMFSIFFIPSPLSIGLNTLKITTNQSRLNARELVVQESPWQIQQAVGWRSL